MVRYPAVSPFVFFFFVLEQRGSSTRNRRDAFFLLRNLSLVRSFVHRVALSAYS